MNRRMLIALAVAAVCAWALWISVRSFRVAAVTKAPARSVPEYNPYPPGILPSDLSSEIARVIRKPGACAMAGLKAAHSNRSAAGPSEYRN